MEHVRMGILGAARIAPAALIRPAGKVARVEVVAMAARDRMRAEKMAARYKIPRVSTDYEALLADPEIDAVYIPLPNGLHGRWTIRALDAGKHVLCEKPFAANAAEAEQMAQAALRSGRVLMEAFHYRYHPLAARMHDIVNSGILGPVQLIETNVCFPLLQRKDIRYRYDLAGGAMMDAGSYAVHLMRLLCGGEPTVRRAEALLISPEVDRAMVVECDLPNGGAGRLTCSLLSTHLLGVNVRVLGELGELRVMNPLVPQLYHRLFLTTDRGRQVQQFPRIPTYRYQLEAFVAAIVDGTPVITGPADSIANMKMIDAIYDCAGLARRQSTA